MNLRRSKRTLKPKVLWEERATFFIAFNTKFIEKTAKLKQKTAPKPSVNSPILETIKINDNDIFKHLYRIELSVTRWEQKGAPSTALDFKILKKAARIKKKTALKPITVDPLLEDVLLNINDFFKLSIYIPPPNLYYQAGQSLATGLSEFKTF